MRDITRTLTTLFLMLATAHVCAAQPAQKSAAPSAESGAGLGKEFAPPGGGFSILFPGTPQSSTQVFKVNGKPLDKYVFDLKVSDADYSVTYFDFSVPGDAVDASRTFLDAMAANAASSSNAQSVSQSEITFDGYAGRLLSATTPDSGLLRAKLVFKGKRLYKIAFKSPGVRGLTAGTTSGYEETATKFLDSFKLLPPELPQGGEVERYLALHRGEIYGASPYASRNPPGAMTSDRIVSGKVVTRPFPPYPYYARDARVTGTVVLAIVVDESGKVIAAQHISGHELLLEESLKTARKTIFAPSLIDDKTVKVAATLSYNFELFPNPPL